MRQEFNSIWGIVSDLSDYLTNQMLGMRPDLDQLRYKADERLKELAGVIRKIRHFGLPKPHAQIKSDEWRFDFNAVLQELEEACRNHVTETARLAVEIPPYQSGAKEVQQRDEKWQKAHQSRLRTKGTIEQIRQRLHNLSQKIDWRATQQSVAAPDAEARSESSRSRPASAAETTPPPHDRSRGQTPRSSAPCPQNMAVLKFMIFWEHELRTGAGYSGQPEHYPLPEQGDMEEDRAALKLLRLCCGDYWGGEQTIPAFLNSPCEVQRPILVRMQAIVDAAKLAAFRATFPGCAPAAGPPAVAEDAPAGPPTAEALASLALQVQQSAAVARPVCGTPAMSDPLDAILSDPQAAARRRREQRAKVVVDERRQRLRALSDAWVQRFPMMDRDCPELGRRPTQDEHFTVWAGRLKSWGCAVNGCGARARNALHDWRPPEGLAPEQLRRANFARAIALRAAAPVCTAADIENDLRRTCTEENAELLSTLFLPSEWLGRIHNAIVEAVVRKPGAASGAAAPAAGAAGQAPRPEQEHCADREPGEAERIPQRGDPPIEAAPEQALEATGKGVGGESFRDASLPPGARTQVPEREDNDNKQPSAPPSVANTGGEEGEAKNPTYPFGVVLDENRKQASRGRKVARFGGCVVAWLVFKALLWRHPNYYPPKELGKDVWEGELDKPNTDETTVSRGVTDLREIIGQIDLTVSCPRGLGYILEKGALRSTSQYERKADAKGKAKKKPKKR
jgi:hypothetical protein